MSAKIGRLPAGLGRSHSSQGVVDDMQGHDPQHLSQCRQVASIVRRYSGNEPLQSA